MAALITRREEARALRLAGSQPESAGELTELLAEFASRVVAFATEAPRVRRRLAKSRSRVVAVDYREDKPKRGRPPIRLAEVGFYDYDKNVLVVAVVDPFAEEVIELFEREGSAPPISDEELDEARELLAEIPELRKALRRKRARVTAFPTPSYAFLADSGREGHRGAAVYVDTAEGAELHAVVDLSDRELVPDEQLDPTLRGRQHDR
jgi:DNA primase large subunit